jgi:hypothetical protein
MRRKRHQPTTREIGHLRDRMEKSWDSARVKNGAQFGVSGRA